MTKDILFSKYILGVPLSIALYHYYLEFKAGIGMQPSVKKSCLDG